MRDDSPRLPDLQPLLGVTHRPPPLALRVLRKGCAVNLSPLTTTELVAIMRRHQARDHALRQRGWNPQPKITRSLIADLVLDRWLLKQRRNP